MIYQAGHTLLILILPQNLKCRSSFRFCGRGIFFCRTDHLVLSAGKGFVRGRRKLLTASRKAYTTTLLKRKV